MSPVLLGKSAGQWWAVVKVVYPSRPHFDGQEVVFFVGFPNIALLYSRVVTCYILSLLLLLLLLLLMTHIYIYINFCNRLWGPGPGLWVFHMWFHGPFSLHKST